MVGAADTEDCAPHCESGSCETSIGRSSLPSKSEPFGLNAALCAATRSSLRRETNIHDRSHSTARMRVPRTEAMFGLRGNVAETKKQNGAKDGDGMRESYGTPRPTLCNSYGKVPN